MAKQASTVVKRLVHDGLKTRNSVCYGQYGPTSHELLANPTDDSSVTWITDGTWLFQVNPQDIPAELRAVGPGRYSAGKLADIDPEQKSQPWTIKRILPDDSKLKPLEFVQHWSRRVAVVTNRPTLGDAYIIQDGNGNHFGLRRMPVEALEELFPGAQWQRPKRLNKDTINPTCALVEEREGRRETVAVLMPCLLK